MNCEAFLKLDPVAQSLYMGSLIHVCISDDSLYELGKELIVQGTARGLFDKVKIGHEEVFSLENNQHG